MSPFLRSGSRAILVAVFAAGLLGTGPVLAGTSPRPEDQVVAAVDEPAATADPSPSGDPTPSADPTPSGEATPPPSPSPSLEPSPTDAPTPAPDPTATPGPTPTPPPTDQPPGWTGGVNLYRPGTWVRQYWSHTCTAASAQTMLNLITGRSDRTRITQDRIIRYARAHDSLRTSVGSDPMGWANALTWLGAGRYASRTFSSQAAALRHAALRILATRKPVGLLVWQGRHAWTMTGFTATADPRTSAGAVITGIYVAPPLVGTDPAPNSYLPTRSLWTFARYREADGLRSWLNRWVVVAP